MNSQNYSLYSNETKYWIKYLPSDIRARPYKRAKLNKIFIIP